MGIIPSPLIFLTTFRKGISETRCLIKVLEEYQKWKTKLGKIPTSNDIGELKAYLNDCEYVLKATVWTPSGSNEGYYGITLNGEEEFRPHSVSPTGKQVKKIHVKTRQVLNTWDTISKAAVCEGMSASKMSVSIKNKVVFDDDYYYAV